MNILQEILDAKRVEVAERSVLTPLMTLKQEADDQPPPPRFSTSFTSAGMGLLAEVKRRSPSAGTIRDPFDPPAIAAAYQRAGANAVSVLMDEAYFGGGEEHFRAVREAIDLPMLYKEFVIDPWQIWHARALGASVVLLIAAALSDTEMKDYMDEAATCGLEVLLEVHDRQELDRALALNAPIIGINNRNLKTFQTTLDTTLDLMKQVPKHTLLISESGIRTYEDVQRLASAGVQGVLVGEHLLRKPDLEAAVRNLMGKQRDRGSFLSGTSDPA